MGDRYEVTVESGVLRTAGAAWTAPHRWSPEGVAVHGGFTGAHLLHLAVGGCVLNDVHREAAAAGIALDGVRVVVAGGFDGDSWASTGVEYRVEVVAGAGAEGVDALLRRVEQVAEIPRSLSRAVVVRRIGADV